MKKLLLTALMAPMWLGAFAQANDPVVMTVAGKDVTRSEFEYSFNKNSDEATQKDPKALKEYVELFVNYRLKVRAAEDAQLDTLGGYLREFATYRDVQLKPYLKDEAYIDSVARQVYASIKEQVGDSDLVQLGHIFLALPQDAPEAVRLAKKARIDSIYAALQGGANFEEMARKHSEDQMSAPKGGELPWLGPKQTLPEFEAVAYSLGIGQMSAPFLSTVGYHILVMKARKPLESYEEKKADIVTVLIKRGIDQVAAENRIQTLMAEGNKTREQVIDDIIAEADKVDPTLRYLIQEYHDGLLLYEVSSREVWDKASKDEDGLQKHFKKNKKKYNWEAPRFKGFIVMAKNQELADMASEFVKKYKGKEGVAAFNKSVSKDTLKLVRVKYGVFAEGEEAHVDHVHYGKDKPATNKVFPVVKVLGKKYKRPETYEDVRAEVTSDLQAVMEKQWVAELRKKYPVSINEDALKTVNNH